MRRKILMLAWLLFLPCEASIAHEYKIGAIAIDHPWARPTAEGVRGGAAYLGLENTAGEPDTLVGASTPAAEKAEIHETSNDGGIMKMREVKGGIPLPPGANVSFKPGGLHIMLFGLKERLAEGKRIPLTLNFAKAGSITVEAYIEKSPGAERAGTAMHDHGMQ